MLLRLTTRLLLLVALGAPAAAQTVLFSESFESGLANWNATGLWHLQSTADTCGGEVAPFPDGQFCAYYGIDGACNYDTGTAPNQGTLTLSAPIVLPAVVPALSLHCWTRHETEGCIQDEAAYDRFQIEVSINGGSSWIIVGSRCPSIPKGVPPPLDQWLPRGISLSPYFGQSILLRFKFDTVDDFANGARGAFVDKIEVRVEVGSPYCSDGSVFDPNLCPCAGPYNSVPMGYGNMTGCANSEREYGELAGQGNPSVSSDSVVLNATELGSPTVAVLLQSDAIANETPWGDGLVCLTGQPQRIGIHDSVNGLVSFPGPGDPALSIGGSVPPSGATKYYQVLYRDTADYCTSGGFNLTNGYAIYWSP